jgi:transposase
MVRWKDGLVPKRFPKEFRDDVVRVARSGKFTHEEVAHDFHVSLSSLKRWLHQADIDDGLSEGLTTAEQDEIVRLRRDNRRLNMEVEILRRATAYFAKDAAPK